MKLSVHLLSRLIKSPMEFSYLDSHYQIYSSNKLYIYIISVHTKVKVDKQVNKEIRIKKGTSSNEIILYCKDVLLMEVLSY